MGFRRVLLELKKSCSLTGGGFFQFQVSTSAPEIPTLLSLGIHEVDTAIHAT
jgi:hypothetical protein